MASMVYSIATTMYARKRQQEQFQGQILSVAMVCSAVLAMYLDCELQTAVLGIASWALIVALLLSSATHAITQRAWRISRWNTYSPLYAETGLRVV
jgi:hypothetical protein